MSAFNNINKLNIGSDDSSTAANRASRINSLVSRMFARANGEGLASQIKATSSQTLFKSDDNMVQTKLVNASSSIRSSSYSTQNVKTKSTKSKKANGAFKIDSTQSTLKSTASNLSKENTIGLSKQSIKLPLDEQATVTAQSNAGVDVPIIPRRNLFGIRLNHDQLKQDLKDMWRDQIEQQKQRWNFDFETLRPTHVKSASQSNDQNERFKWTRVTYYAPGLPQSSMAPSGFDRNELFNNSQGDYEDYESETEQEDDDALAMPQFYKYQRRLKFNEPEPNRIKMMTITLSQAPARKSPTIVNERLAETDTKKSETSVKVDNETKETSTSQMTFEPIFKMALKNSQPSTLPATSSSSATNVEKKKPEASKKASKASTTTVRRPKAIKRTQPINLQQSSLALSPSTQNLIITFSENRKDTLRSASNNGNTVNSTVSLTSKVKLTAREGETAFVSATTTTTSTESTATKAVTVIAPSPANTDTLKQQSLLGNFL